MTESSLLEEYESVVGSRPAALATYDQWFMGAHDALLRIAFFHDRGDLLNKRLLIIGDDDLLGIAAAITGLPKEVVVLEIDERIINFTNSVAESYRKKQEEDEKDDEENNKTNKNKTNLNRRRMSPLRAIKFDVREDLPSDLRGSFDTFACDPVETVAGCKLFLSRGVSGLRGFGSALYFGLTALECSKRKTFEIQKLVSDMGFALTDNLRGFTEYPDPGWEDQLPIWQSLGVKPTSTWYKSSLYRWEVILEHPKPSIEGEYTGDWNFFIDSESWATTQDKDEKPSSQQQN